MSGFLYMSSHICDSLLFGRGQCFCTSCVCLCDRAGGEESGSSGISLAEDPWERLILIWKMVSAVTRLISFMRQISRAAPCLEGRMGVGRAQRPPHPSPSHPPLLFLPAPFTFFCAPHAPVTQGKGWTGC